MSERQKEENNKLLYNRYLTTISLGKAYDNVQQKSLMDIYKYLKKETDSRSLPNFFDYKTLKRHYERFILKNEVIDLKKSGEFYESFLQINSFVSLQKNYNSEIDAYHQIVEKLKTLNSNKKAIENEINQKPTNKIHIPKIKVKSQVFFITSFFLLIAIVISVLLKNETQTININNFNAANQYFYLVDEDGKYILKDQHQNAKEKPLTPEVFDAYFVQQGYDIERKDIKIIKANYFETKSRITDKEVSKQRNDVSILNIKNEEMEVNKNEVLIKIKSENQIEEKLWMVFSEVFDSLNFVSKPTTNLTKICEINATLNYKKSEVVENGSTSILDIYYKIYNSKNNHIYSQKKLQIQAIGFSESESLNNALNKLKSQLP